MTKYDEIVTKIEDPTRTEDEVEVNEKKMDKVTTVAPKQYKKGILERLVVGLIGPDGIPAIGRKLSSDVILPAIKDIVVNSITRGVNMAVYGQDEDYGRPTGGYSNYGGNARNHWGPQPPTYPKVNYSKAASGRPAPAAATAPTMNRGSYMNEYLIADRTEAINVLAGLRDQIARYGTASVADYYDSIGVDPSYTDNDYGWDDLRSARIVSVRGGYIIQFPRVDVV